MQDLDRSDDQSPDRSNKTFSSFNQHEVEDLLISNPILKSFGPDKATRRDLVSGFCDMVSRRVADGWRPTLLTFMFDQIATSSQTVAMARMLDEVDRVYRTFLTRVVRDPLKGEPPIMLAAVDAPVMKHSKSAPVGAKQNDGLHVHAVLLVPKDSRLKVTAEEHFADRQRRYLRPDHPLVSVHAKSIVDDGRNVTDYVFKSIKSGRLPYDDAVLVLPRTPSEVS